MFLASKMTSPKRAWLNNHFCQIMPEEPDGSTDNVQICNTSGPVYESDKYFTKLHIACKLVWFLKQLWDINVCLNSSCQAEPSESAKHAESHA